MQRWPPQSHVTLGRCPRNWLVMMLVRPLSGRNVLLWVLCFKKNIQKTNPTDSETEPGDLGIWEPQSKATWVCLLHREGMRLGRDVWLPEQPGAGSWLAQNGYVGTGDRCRSGRTLLLCNGAGWGVAASPSGKDSCCRECSTTGRLLESTGRNSYTC